jgi:hypothetical protein
MVKAANRFHKAFRTAMGDGILFEGQRRINGAPQRVYEFSDRVTTKWESPYPIDYDIEDFFAQIKM